MPSPSLVLSELKLWKQFWMRKAELGSWPRVILQQLQMCIQTSILITIGCTLPISSCEAEKSFQASVWRTKMFFCSSMTNREACELVLMHLHNDMEGDVNIICQQFIQKNNRRMFQSCIALLCQTTCYVLSCIISYIDTHIIHIMHTIVIMHKKCTCFQPFLYKYSVNLGLNGGAYSIPLYPGMGALFLHIWGDTP